MDTEKFDLFLVLIKLKSYLISLIDEPEACYNTLDLTNEYLDRRCPAQKDFVVHLLLENNIKTDLDIVFDETIHEKFRQIAHSNQQINLLTLLKELEIESQDLNKENNLRDERENRLKKIIQILFKLARIWNARKEIEENVEDYSILQEEDVLRPEEELHLVNLDKVTSISYETISVLTRKYIELLVDYYFVHGGDLSLKRFLKDIEQIKELVDSKYTELFKSSGLDKDSLDKIS